MTVMMELYDRIVDPDLTIRRVNVVAVNLIKEDEIPEEAPEQLNLFVDYEKVERRREAERQHDAKERKIQEATLAIQQRYGKNAMLKGMNFLDGATTRLRNRQIGGHAAEQPTPASSRDRSSTPSNSTSHPELMTETDIATCDQDGGDDL